MVAFMASIQRQDGRIAVEVLDDTDRRLLAELQVDARVSRAELGRRVGLSAPAVAERLRRLEDDGVIVGHHTVGNPRALGLALTVVIRVRPAPPQIPKGGAAAAATPEAGQCLRVTGADPLGAPPPLP